MWSECGGQAGLKEVSRKLMTLIAAGGQKGKPLNAVCDTCGELKVMHKSDRLNLVVHACNCGVNEVEDVADGLGRRPAATEPASKRTRGFEADLDPMGQGIFETYTRKCARDGVAERACA